MSLFTPCLVPFGAGPRLHVLSHALPTPDSKVCHEEKVYNLCFPSSTHHQSTASITATPTQESNLYSKSNSHLIPKMQFSTILAALALAATSVLSQDLTGLPACAATCFTDNFANSACASTDVACLCGDSTFFSDVEICVLTTCDSADTTSKSLFRALDLED